MAASHAIERLNQTGELPIVIALQVIFERRRSSLSVKGKHQGPSNNRKYKRSERENR